MFSSPGLNPGHPRSWDVGPSAARDLAMPHGRRAGKDQDRVGGILHLLGGSRGAVEPIAASNLGHVLKAIHPVAVVQHLEKVRSEGAN